MSKKSVTKTEYEEAVRFVDQINRLTAEGNSHAWLYGQPDFTNPIFRQYADEYIAAQQRIAQYILTHAHGLSNT